MLEIVLKKDNLLGVHFEEKKVINEKPKYLPHGECVVAVTKRENCLNVTRWQSLRHLQLNSERDI